MTVETCPKCGAPLLHLTIATLPPIPAVRCISCGYYHEEEREKIEYVPYRERGREGETK